jgi:chromosomal replication initiator protein
MSNPGANIGTEIQETLVRKRGTVLLRPHRVRQHFGMEMTEDDLDRLSRESKAENGTDRKPERSDEGQMMLPGFGSYSCPSLSNRRFTFDQFVVGPCNRFAYQAALAVAKKKRSAYNPLYLYGESGLGKSHLSGAIGNYFYKVEPVVRIVYVTAEEFVNEMVSAIRKKEMWKFKEKYRRQCDILFIDGVHFLSGKEKTQSELSHTLDHLYHSGKQIILTANVPPHLLSHMTDGLKSRLGCGLVVDIHPPDLETRRRILRRRAEFEGVALPEDVVNLIASRVWGNVRRLEGLLINLMAKSSLMCRPIERELAEEVIGLFEVAENRQVTITSIQKQVACQYQIEVKQLISRSRRKSTCHPRQIAMYLSRKFTNESLDAIGRAFCRDHASVIHSIGVIEREIKDKAKVRREIDFLIEKLKSPERI